MYDDTPQQEHIQYTKQKTQKINKMMKILFRENIIVFPYIIIIRVIIITKMPQKPKNTHKFLCIRVVIRLTDIYTMIYKSCGIQIRKTIFSTFFILYISFQQTFALSLSLLNLYNTHTHF